MRSAAVVCCVVASLTWGISRSAGAGPASADHSPADRVAADLVVTDARIYTSGPQRDMAYTINGARFLGRDSEAGSIETGKSADFIVLDRDILKLADDGHAVDIRNTAVLQTWFMGKSVYVSKNRNNSAKRGLTK